MQSAGVSLVLAFFLNEGNPPCLRAVLRLATSLCFITEYIPSSAPESGARTSRHSELSSAQSNMTFIRNAIEGHLVIIDFAFYVLCFGKNAALFYAICLSVGGACVGVHACVGACVRACVMHVLVPV